MTTRREAGPTKPLDAPRFLALIDAQLAGELGVEQAQ